jgi:hypothetical protein
MPAVAGDVMAQQFQERARQANASAKFVAGNSHCCGFSAIKLSQGL